jgi:predicted Fe-Mo cluster-binding NifX family protein
VTRYQIESPVRSFTGESVGVSFQKGTGYVTDETKDGRAALEYFRRHGYGVAPAPEHTIEEAVQALVTGTPVQRVPVAPTVTFNPADHGVEEVLAHLGEADREEAERVLDAEAATKKPRVTITSQRDEILAAKTPAAPADDKKGPVA